MADPILFVPGLLCTEVLYAPQMTALADHPVMVADHTRQDAIPDIVEDILKTAPERFSLIGLSMGSYIAMALLRAAPERVSRVAMIATNARADVPEQTKRRKFLIELARKKNFEKVPHLLYPGFVHEKRENDPALRQIVVDMAIDTGPDAFVRQQTALIARIDSRPFLKEIGCPALVVVGDGDRLTPPHLAREIHNLIPGSRLAVIAGSGHLPTLEEPDQTTAVLKNWLLN
ncbi:alpha/beta fold hydrolase [Roseibium sp. RKSG952]|uniref:alpha/beta fold hydrolase n=1 Tax=Roseibium sp. RKSG952 TaxID=2529384 RepID=UPI0012BD04FC|nr:alpha/beta fold hydrolase [Roseibium sp. RKSG952]MTH99253.1 alpha/beta fold hydrolase [Roseibium sp. RKSG952]